MNINIYLEDSLGSMLNKFASKTGKSRNALIREAIKEWVTHQEVKQWPNSIFKFTGVGEMPTFESYRDDLLPAKEDPLA